MSGRTRLGGGTGRFSVPAAPPSSGGGPRVWARACTECRI